MFKKTDPRYDAGGEPTKTSALGTATMRNQDPTPIGPSIHIKGEIRGNEDLVVHGRVEGTIDIGEGLLMVTKEGQIDADVTARVINIAGRAEGDLQASEQVIVRKTGQVRGKIAAPRVGLDFGCKFSGSIDSDAKKKAEKKPDSTVKKQKIADFKAAISGTSDNAVQTAVGKSQPH